MKLKKYNIVDALEAIIDYRGRTPNKSETGIPTLSAKSVKMGYIDYDQCYFISPKEYESFMVRGFPRKGDVLVTTEAPLGVVAQLDRDDVAIAQRLLTIRGKKGVLDNAFLFYYLQSSAGQQRLIARQSGSTVMGIRQEEFRKIEIEIPSFQIQQQIASVLSNLDRKIALNRAINRNLEALAKQLYDYWFVQFDFPDKNGRPYKSSGGKMVWNEVLKRNIPKEWDVRKLKHCIEHINTGLNPRRNFTFGGSIKYITVKNLTLDGSIDFSGCDTIDEIAKAKVNKRSQIKKGDVLYASICPLGRTYLIRNEPKEWDINESVFSIRPKHTILSSEFLHMMLKDDYYTQKFSQKSTGSIFLGIRIHELEDTDILVPQKSILDSFSKIIGSVTAKQGILHDNITRLTALRDELLPLLMNGQVTIE